MNQFENIINGIAERANEAITREDDDFVNSDGLLICGKCRTPKQVRVEMFGVSRTLMCLCKCGEDKQRKEEAQRKRQKRLERIKELREIGFPDVEMRSWTFDRDDGANAELSKIAHNYVEHFAEMKERGKGLLLYGGVGTGKTFASACIANALIDKGYSCLVTNFARLANTLNGMYAERQEYLDRLNRFSLLVIDDLSAERGTEYMDEIVHTVIDARCRSGKPLIATTNLSKEDFTRASDVRKQRIYSRLLEMCVPYEVKGVDRRREKLKADNEDIKKLLGME